MSTSAWASSTASTASTADCATTLVAASVDGVGVGDGEVGGGGSLVLLTADGATVTGAMDGLDRCRPGIVCTSAAAPATATTVPTIHRPPQPKIEFHASGPAFVSRMW